MSRRLIGVALAASLALTALPAAAAEPSVDLFAAFQKVCIEHQGDQEGARAAALAMGLTLSTKPAEDDPNHEIDAAYVPPGPFSWAVMLTHPVMGEGRYKTTGYAIQAPDAEMTLYKAAVAWPGLEGSPGANGRMNFAYLQTAEGRARLPESDFNALLRSGQVRGMIVLRGDFGTFITLITFAPLD